MNFEPSQSSTPAGGGFALCPETCLWVCIVCMKRSTNGVTRTCTNLQMASSDLTRSRRYRFTANNPTLLPEDWAAKFKSLAPVKNLVFQLEIGELEGTPHYQGYVELTRQAAYGPMATAMGCTFLRADRSAAANRDYASKASTRAESLDVLGDIAEGIPASLSVSYDDFDDDAPGQGYRSDLAAVIRTAQSGTTRKRLMDEHPESYLRYPRALSDFVMEYQPHRTTDPLVTLVIGPPGVGKSFWVRHVAEEEPDQLFCKEPGSKWWDGLQAQRTVLLDDFTGASTGSRLDVTLRMLDAYDYRPEVKGGSCNLLCGRIFLTSNLHPMMWFTWKGRNLQYWALARRIHQVLFFPPGSDTPVRALRVPFFNPDRRELIQFTEEEGGGIFMEAPPPEALVSDCRAHAIEESKNHYSILDCEECCRGSCSTH